MTIMHLLQELQSSKILALAWAVTLSSYQFNYTNEKDYADT